MPHDTNDFRIDTWRQVNGQGTRELKAHLDAGFPVLFGAGVDDGFLQAGVGYLRDASRGTRAVAASWATTTRAGRDELWGSSSGDGGCGWVSYEDFRRVAREAYVAKAAHGQPPPTAAVDATSMERTVHGASVMPRGVGFYKKQGTASGGSGRTSRRRNRQQPESTDCGLYREKPGRNVMKRSMITNQALINHSEPRSGEEPTSIQRRTVIGGALVGLLSFPGRVMAQGKAVPTNSFVVLLKGLYHPVIAGTGPDLGLSMVDLNDGSYFTTKIYPVSGTPGNTNLNKAIGNFYVQLGTGDLCAYHIPGGSFAMRFTGMDFVFVDDGDGGQFLEGTFELTILEATGIYRSFVLGHNHMVDKLHFLASGDIDEYCFCFITGP
jgi:hypothetical protein